MEPLKEVNDLDRILTPGGRKSASKKAGAQSRRRSLLGSDHEVKAQILVKKHPMYCYYSSDGNFLILLDIVAGIAVLSTKDGI
jgi:hypothetical protein